MLNCYIRLLLRRHANEATAAVGGTGRMSAGSGKKGGQKKSGRKNSKRATLQLQGGAVASAAAPVVATVAVQVDPPPLLGLPPTAPAATNTTSTSLESASLSTTAVMRSIE